MSYLANEYLKLAEKLKGDKIVPHGQYSRWLMCINCGLIDTDAKFVAYGGRNNTNKGVCRYCYWHDPTIIQQLWTPAVDPKV